MDAINVFLSRPTWIAPAYETGLKAFITRLTDSGFSPRTLGSSDYPTKSPLDEVILLMEQCKGAIILGYPQISIEVGTCRDKALSPSTLLPTEWNHIEAGLAYARNLPLLVIHHTGVGRGIFDRGAINSFIYDLDLGDPAWPLLDSITGALTKWRERVTAHRSTSPGAPATAPPPKGAVPCPNCSSNERPFFLTKLEPDFQQLTGGTHYCPRCKSNFNYK